jgi:2,3-bisphosphoglycerate-dependent phosphoglycerate mutase
VTRLYLIRHGQAFCNVRPFGLIAGMRGDAGLTPLGRTQAERLRDRLAATGEITADVLISSTLPRARETAEIVAPALGLPIIFDGEFQEQSPGDFDGRAWEEIKDEIPNQHDEPFRPFGPNGENWGQFILRVGSALNRILHQYESKTIVVVCHGGVIDASFLIFFGMNTLVPPETAFYTRNTSITRWERHEIEGYSLRWRLTGYNDDLHTRDIGTGLPIHWTRFAEPMAPANEAPALPIPTEDF